MENNKLTIKDSSLSFFIGFLLCQLGVVFVSIVGVFVCSIFNINLENLAPFLNTASGYLLCVLGMDIAMVFVFIFFNRKKDNHLLSKPTIAKLSIYIFIAITSYFLLYPIINCLDSLFVSWNVELNTIPYSLTTQNYFISLISLVLLPAICEELLFRGLILKGLKPYGKVFSITLTAIMFAIFHMSIDQFAYPLLMGLLLSFVMYKENNIIYCIAIHAINNFMSLTFAYFNINLLFNHWTYILLAIVLVLAFITALIISIAKLNQNHKQNLTKTDKFYLIITLLVMIVMWIIINIDKIL